MAIFYSSGKPNILVTGGAGFIGSNLIDKLLTDNHVICIDDFSTGQENNIDHLLQNANFEFVRHNLVEPIDLLKLPELKKFHLATQGIQQIYHLACPTAAYDNKKMLVETLVINSQATKNTLDLAHQFKAKLLFVSSSAVYGETEGREPIREDYWGMVNIFGERANYYEGKRFAECLVHNYGLANNLEVKVVRLFNTYGPRMKIEAGFMIPDLICRALANEAITIHGQKDWNTTFCYIDDAIDGLIKVMNNKVTSPINIGSDQVVKLSQLVDNIIQLTESKSQVTFDNFVDSQLIRNIPSLELIKNETEWMPFISLEKGLKQTIDEIKINAHHYILTKK